MCEIVDISQAKIISDNFLKVSGTCVGFRALWKVAGVCCTQTPLPTAQTRPVLRGRLFLFPTRNIARNNVSVCPLPDTKSKCFAAAFSPRREIARLTS